MPETPLRTGLEGPAPHGFTALLLAVRAGHIDAVRVLLDAGADVNDTLPDGMSTVVLAATNAHWELGVHLVDRGADPNGAAQGWTALHAMTWVRMPNFGFNPPGPVTTGSMDSLPFARALAARLPSLLSKGGWITRLPGPFGGWTAQRDMAAPAGRTFQAQWRVREGRR